MAGLNRWWRFQSSRMENQRTYLEIANGDSAPNNMNRIRIVHVRLRQPVHVNGIHHVTDMPTCEGFFRSIYSIVAVPVIFMWPTAYGTPSCNVAAYDYICH